MKKDAQLHVRVSESDRLLVEVFASILGVPISDFVIDTIKEAILSKVEKEKDDFLKQIGDAHVKHRKLYEVYKDQIHLDRANKASWLLAQMTEYLNKRSAK